MIYYILRPFLMLYRLIVYPFKIYGKENLINEGNTVVISNHLGNADIMIMGNLYKGKTYFITKKEWFDNKIIGWIFKQLGGIPIDRDKVDLQATKNALKILKSNKRLAIYPEGTRNKTGTNEIQPLHGGAGLFAYKTNAKIQPLNIHHKSKPFRMNYIYIGKAFDFSEFSDCKHDADLNAKLTNKMYEKLVDAKNQLNIILQNKNKK